MINVKTIGRLSELLMEYGQVVHALAPGYAALDALGQEVDCIEKHPVYGPLWEKSMALRDEHQKILMDLMLRG